LLKKEKICNFSNIKPLFIMGGNNLLGGDMKKVFLTVLFVMLVLPLCVSAFSDDYGFTYGDWEIGSNRLYQGDIDTGIAKAWLKYPQKGVVEYRFNVRYEDGFFDDAHAGFGLHIFVDKPAKGFSWGEGDSYLFWLNYDKDPVSDRIHQGLSAQIYKSESNWKMKLLQSIDLSHLEEAIMHMPKNTLLPVRIVVDGRTGDVKLYDPINEWFFYSLKLGNDKPLKGDFVSLRTNSGAFSFGF
jgi:hypothetical protein